MVITIRRLTFPSFASPIAKLCIDSHMYYSQLRYNDVSPMENHHLSAAFSLMQTEPDLNFLEGMAPKALSAMRKQSIDAVLATDMKQHFSMVR